MRKVVGYCGHCGYGFRKWAFACPICRRPRRPQRVGGTPGNSGDWIQDLLDLGIGYLAMDYLDRYEREKQLEAQNGIQNPPGSL